MESQVEKPMLTQAPHSTARPEREHTGSIWTHPYSLYIVLTAFIFIFVVIMGWLAWTAGWIPHRTA